MSRRYNRPPWEFGDVPEEELIYEAEMLDVEDELKDLG